MIVEEEYWVLSTIDFIAWESNKTGVGCMWKWKYPSSGLGRMVCGLFHLIRGLILGNWVFVSVFSSDINGGNIGYLGRILPTLSRVNNQDLFMRSVSISCHGFVQVRRKSSRLTFLFEFLSGTNYCWIWISMPGVARLHVEMNVGHIAEHLSFVISFNY